MPAVYAIADVHLSFATPNKAMDVFGARWEHHAERLADHWQSTVREGDLVLIPGDVSWAMYLKDALPDLEFLARLNGEKLLLRGNHDYWWSSYTRLRAALPPSVHALQNDAFLFHGLAVCGTRGWTSPLHAGFSESDDRKLYQRELIRLSLSLAALPKDAPAIAMLHYPPFSEQGKATEFCERLSETSVDTAVYGHLHGVAAHPPFEGVYEGVNYRFVAADQLDFTPLCIREQL